MANLRCEPLLVCWFRFSHIILQADYLATVFGTLYSVFLSSLYHEMEKLPKLKASEVKPYLSILQTIEESNLIERFEIDISARILDIQNQIKASAQRHYDAKWLELKSAPGVNRALPMLLMTDEMEKNFKYLDKNFGEPILGYVLACFVISLGF